MSKQERTTLKALLSVVNVKVNQIKKPVKCVRRPKAEVKPIRLVGGE